MLRYFGKIMFFLAMLCFLLEFLENFYKFMVIFVVVNEEFFLFRDTHTFLDNWIWLKPLL